MKSHSELPLSPPVRFPPAGALPTCRSRSDALLPVLFLGLFKPLGRSLPGSSSSPLRRTQGTAELAAARTKKSRAIPRDVPRPLRLGSAVGQRLSVRPASQGVAWSGELISYAACISAEGEGWSQLSASPLALASPLPSRRSPASPRGAALHVPALLGASRQRQDESGSL